LPCPTLPCLAHLQLAEYPGSFNDFSQTSFTLGLLNFVTVFTLMPTVLLFLNLLKVCLYWA
jgi:hypothetical protein